MDWNKVFFLFPYVICLGITCGIFLYTWRFRQIQGAGAYLWYVGAQVLWSLGFIFELLSPGLNGKVFWDGIQWIPGAVIAIVFPIFAVTYTGIKLRTPRLVWGLAGIVPLAWIAMLLTEPWHHLLYPNPALSSGPYFSQLTYDFTWAIYAYAIYSYLVTFSSLGILLRSFIRPQQLYRRQILTVAVGFIIPIGGTILTTLGMDFKPYRDITPFTFALGNLIVAWGLFHFKLFDVVPVARDIVFENISDSVVVLDNQNRVVEINTAALTLLGKNSKQVIGQPAMTIMALWPEIINKFRDSGAEKQKEEFALTIEGQEAFIEVDVNPIIDKRKRVVGRVFVGRDITHRKHLEEVLINMARELEQRVQDRTRDLAEAYDTTLEGWARALELRDKETEGHSRSVTELTLHLAMLMNIPQEELVQIRRGALLHDIGKMGIPDEILRKPAALTPAERTVVEAHPEIAFRLLAPIAFLQKALEIPHYHHERWDGSGYPSGLKGEQIPLAARIFAVVDVWDAMRSERPYHGPIPEEEVMAYIEDQSGRHFDPAVVKAFTQLYNQGWT